MSRTTVLGWSDPQTVGQPLKEHDELKGSNRSGLMLGWPMSSVDLGNEGKGFQSAGPDRGGHQTESADEASGGLAIMAIYDSNRNYHEKLAVVVESMPVDLKAYVRSRPQCNAHPSLPASYGRNLYISALPSLHMDPPLKREVKVFANGWTPGRYRLETQAYVYHDPGVLDGVLCSLGYEVADTRGSVRLYCHREHPTRTVEVAVQADNASHLELTGIQSDVVLADIGQSGRSLAQLIDLIAPRPKEIGDVASL